MTDSQIPDSAFRRFFTKKRAAIMACLSVGIVACIAAWPTHEEEHYHRLSEVPYAIDAKALNVASFPVMGLRENDRVTIWGSDPLPAGTQTLESEDFGVIDKAPGYDIAIIATKAVTPDCQAGNTCVTRVQAIATGAGFDHGMSYADSLTGGCPIDGKNRMSFGAGRKLELTCKG